MGLIKNLHQLIINKMENKQLIEKEITELKSVIKEASNKVELLEKSLKETDFSK